MSAPKKRTPRSIERHAANRAANEARHEGNLRLVRENGLGGQKRPSKLVREDQRALAFIRSHDDDGDAA